VFDRIHHVLHSIEELHGDSMNLKAGRAPNGAPQAGRFRAFALATGVAIVGIAACSATTTIGRPFDPNLINQLRPGVSTMEDAKRLFGAPDYFATNAAGEIDLEWAYGQAVGGQGQVARVAVIFGPDGRMIRVRGIAQTTIR
jgi:hypothetical protein